MLGRIGELGAERLAALLLITFSGAQLYGSLQLSMSEPYTLGPGALPAIFSVAVLILAVVLLLQASKEASPDADSVEVADDSSPDYKAGLLLFALVVVFVASIHFIGFLGGMILFALLYLLLGLRWPVLQAFAFSVVWGGGVYYGFVHILGAQLESGILFNAY